MRWRYGNEDVLPGKKAWLAKFNELKLDTTHICWYLLEFLWVGQREGVDLEVGHTVIVYCYLYSIGSARLQLFYSYSYCDSSTTWNFVVIIEEMIVNALLIIPDVHYTQLM